MMCSCEEFDHCYRCRCDWAELEKMIRDETAFPILFRYVHMIHGFSSPFSFDFCTMDEYREIDDNGSNDISLGRYRSAQLSQVP
jgi:hypothetical protein